MYSLPHMYNMHCAHTQTESNRTVQILAAGRVTLIISLLTPKSLSSSRKAQCSVKSMKKLAPSKWACSPEHCSLARSSVEVGLLHILNPASHGLCDFVSYMFCMTSPLPIDELISILNSGHFQLVSMHPVSRATVLVVSILEIIASS